MQARKEKQTKPNTRRVKSLRNAKNYTRVIKEIAENPSENYKLTFMIEPTVEMMKRLPQNVTSLTFAETVSTECIKNIPLTVTSVDYYPDKQNMSAEELDQAFREDIELSVSGRATHYHPQAVQRNKRKAAEIENNQPNQDQAIEQADKRARVEEAAEKESQSQAIEQPGQLPPKNNKEKLQQTAEQIKALVPASVETRNNKDDETKKIEKQKLPQPQEEAVKLETLQKEVADLKAKQKKLLHRANEQDEKIENARHGLVELKEKLLKMQVERGQLTSSPRTSFSPPLSSYSPRLFNLLSPGSSVGGGLTYDDVPPKPAYRGRGED